MAVQEGKSKDCEDNRGGSLDHNVIQNRAQQDKVSASLQLPSSIAPTAHCWYPEYPAFPFPSEALLAGDHKAADGEGTDGPEPCNLSTSNAVAAALIVSEQLQQVKHTYLTRCLLAGSSTLASIN